MITHRKTGNTFGFLLIAGLIFGIFSSVPAIEHPDYLTKLAANRWQVLGAVFCQLAMACVYTFIAVLLFPFIKKYDEKMALGYFGFRIIGAVFLFGGIVTLLLLLALSDSLSAAKQQDLYYFQTTGLLLRQIRDWMNHLAAILPWTIGGLILYYCLKKMKLIPFWLAAWGLTGSFLTLVSTLLLLFDLIKIITPIYIILNAPMALFELILAVFLISKGFNPITNEN